jgi:hypothetical protein
MFRHNKTKERNVGASSHITFMRPQWSPSSRGGYPGRLLCLVYRKASFFERSARGRVLASSVIEVRAILPSPSCAERSSPEATTYGCLAVRTTSARISQVASTSSEGSSCGTISSLRAMLILSKLLGSSSTSRCSVFEHGKALQNGEQTLTTSLPNHYAYFSNTVNTLSTSI